MAAPEARCARAGVTVVHGRPLTRDARFARKSGRAASRIKGEPQIGKTRLLLMNILLYERGASLNNQLR